MPTRTATTLRTVAALLCVGACAPGAAHAGAFGAEPIDGPNADLVAAGDVDVARDGTGAVAYVKRDGGVAHIFLSRFVNGAFQPPERLDVGVETPSSAPVVAAGENGRLAVAFTSGGGLLVAVRPNASTPFVPLQVLSASGSAPSIDMSINGVSYVSFTAPGGGGTDVRVARLARDTEQFAVLGDVIDVDANRAAGDGTKRSHVAVSADGTAVVAWGEDHPDGRTHVLARRVFGTRISVAPQDLTVDAIEGRAGGSADLVDIDIEDDSSYAWAAFRQRLDDGRAHVIARRLVGSVFEAPALVDGFGLPASADAAEVAIEMSGRGEGIAVTAAGGAGVFGALLHDDLFNPGQAFGSAAGSARPAAGVGENNDVFATWLPGDGTARMRDYQLDIAKRTLPPPGPEVVLSRPDFGAVDPAAGLDIGVNRVGDANAVFVQEAPDGRRLVVGGFDRPPGAFQLNSGARFRRQAQPSLSWGRSFELQGAITYRVEVDGVAIGETTDIRLVPGAPIADGDHTWRVTATDRRGQVTGAPAKPLRIDTLPPVAAIGVTGTKRRGGKLTVKVKANDGSLTRPGGSGIRKLSVDYGDRTKPSTRRTSVHRYARGGKFTIRVTVTDVAGNVGTVTRRITIKKK